MHDGERAPYLARLHERRASAAARSVRFWAFEHEAERGRFLEFIETSDRSALDSALAHDALFSEALDSRLPPTHAEASARIEIFGELIAAPSGAAAPLGTTAPHP